MTSGSKSNKTLIQQPIPLDVQFPDSILIEFSHMAEVLALEIWGMYDVHFMCKARANMWTLFNALKVLLKLLSHHQLSTIFSISDEITHELMLKLLAKYADSQHQMNSHVSLLAIQSNYSFTRSFHVGLVSMGRRAEKRSTPTHLL